MNQLSTIAAPRSLDELKSASIKYTKLLHSGAGEELQAFFDEIFNSALAAVAAVDPHEAVLYGPEAASPMQDKRVATASRQDIRDELRSAIAPLMLTAFLQRPITNKQLTALLFLLAAHFGVDNDTMREELLNSARFLELSTKPK